MLYYHPPVKLREGNVFTDVAILSTGRVIGRYPLPTPYLSPFYLPPSYLLPTYLPTPIYLPLPTYPYLPPTCVPATCLSAYLPTPYLPPPSTPKWSKASGRYPTGMHSCFLTVLQVYPVVQHDSS